MDKRKITKAIANNLNAFAISSVTTGLVRSNMRPSPNPIINVLITTSAFVGSWNVAGTIGDPVRERTERKIDEFFDMFEKQPKKD